MTTNRARPGFFEVPHAAVYALMTATVLASGFCFIQAGGSAAPSELLFRYGGMYSAALARHEYWRLIAYGFLHVNFIHLTTNMLCLVLWGGHLERRVGPAYFVIIYFCATAFGAITAMRSTRRHTSRSALPVLPRVSSARCCACGSSASSMSASDFFAINIGLNVAFAISNSRIDWAVHLGGFAAGLIACAVLDLVEKVTPCALRCKFPETVKVNLVLLGCAAALWLWTNQAQALSVGAAGWIAVAGLTVACCTVVKLIDLALSIKKGLAIVVAALAVANAACVVLGVQAVAASACVARWPRAPQENLLGTFCSNSMLVAGLTAAGAVALTLLACSRDIYRGIEDVGFVGASLRAERNRRYGL